MRPVHLTELVSYSLDILQVKINCLFSLVLSSEELLLPQVIECVDPKTCASVISFQLSHNEVKHNLRKEKHLSRDWA